MSKYVGRLLWPFWQLTGSRSWPYCPKKAPFPIVSKAEMVLKRWLMAEERTLG